jgi:hypothetical protein
MVTNRNPISISYSRILGRIQAGGVRYFAVDERGPRPIERIESISLESVAHDPRIEAIKMNSIVSGWEPIATAPRDDTKLIAMTEDSRPGGPATMIRWDCNLGDWVADDDGVLGKRTIRVRPTVYLPIARIAAEISRHQG